MMNKMWTAAECEARVIGVMDALEALPHKPVDGSCQAIVDNPGLFVGLARILSRAECNDEAKNWQALLSKPQWHGLTQYTLGITDPAVVSALEESGLEFDKTFSDLRDCVAQLAAEHEAAAAALPRREQQQATTVPRGDGRVSSGAKTTLGGKTTAGKRPMLTTPAGKTTVGKRPTRPQATKPHADNQGDANRALGRDGGGPVVRKATPVTDAPKHKRTFANKHWK